MTFRSFIIQTGNFLGLRLGGVAGGVPLLACPGQLQLFLLPVESLACFSAVELGNAWRSTEERVADHYENGYRTCHPCTSGMQDEDFRFPSGEDQRPDAFFSGYRSFVRSEIDSAEIIWRSKQADAASTMLEKVLSE